MFMRKLIAVLLFAGLASVTIVARQQPNDAGQKSARQDKKDKSAPNGEANADAFSQAVANDVLSQVRAGLEGHSRRLMLGAFDKDKMDGYLSFEDQIEALFQRYDSFRVHYRIVDTSVEGGKGVAMVEWEMEEIPNSGSSQHRNGQIKFVMERGRKGWKVVELNPRRMFS